MAMNPRQAIQRDYRAWRADVASVMPALPPYRDDMPVTPGSVFGQHCWTFPPEWMVAGREDRNGVDFLGSARFGDAVVRLSPGEDATLLRQAKEAMVVFLHRRTVLADENRRSWFGKPGGAHGVLAKLRRFMCACKTHRCSSLSQVTPDILKTMMVVLGATDGNFDAYASLVEDLLAMSRKGLIIDGLRALDFELERAKAPEDTTKEKGWQPIPDVELSQILKKSNLFIDRANDIAEKLSHLVQNPERRRLETAAWAEKEFGVELFFEQEDGATVTQSAELIAANLYALVAVAAGNLVAFHTGMRVSELLSIRRNALDPSGDDGIPTLDLDRVDLDFQTFKTVAGFKGQTRRISVHPRIRDAFQALRAVQRPFKIEGDRLFCLLSPKSEDPWVLAPAMTRLWNYRLDRFCDLLGIEHHLTSHQWRKTIAAVGARVLTGPTLALKELFGHESLAMTARYILASPFIRDELRDLTLDEYRKRGRTLLESMAALGGDGLGGKYGRQLETNFARFLEDTDITEDKIGKSLDAWVEDMLKQGIYPVPVMPGVMCLKPVGVASTCARTSKDTLADPSRCSGSCPYQVQEAHRKPLLKWTIESLVSKHKNWSKNQQSYWASQCKNQMSAWPDLADELRDEIAKWPLLLHMIEDAAHGS